MAQFLMHVKNGTRCYPRINTLLVRNKFWSSTPIKKDTTYKIVKPGNVSKQITHDSIPNHIILPPYAKSGIPPPINDQVRIYIFVSPCLSRAILTHFFNHF